MNEYVLYILMRNDLPSMNVGRAAAQASHAANAFIHSFGKRKDVKEWQKSTLQGFGTAIILSAGFETIYHIIKELPQNTPAKMVYDPEYGMPVTEEVFNLIDSAKVVGSPIIKDDGTIVFFRCVDTCAFIFGKKDELFKYVGELPLFPENHERKH